MRIVHARTGALIETVTAPRGVAVLAHRSPNGKYVAGQLGETIDIWEPAAGKEIASLAMSVSNDVQSADFDPSSRRIAVRQTRSTILLFDIEKATELWSVDLGEPIRCLLFHRQGRYLLAGAESGNLFVIDAASGKTERTIAVGFPIGAISFAPDGTQVILFNMRGGYKTLGPARR
ncbi:MAG: hypothetical protein A2Z34_05300 [Planctomycetes bacterium RBG_16_59_8]|nr:MAG: hypothetical protein A2Z34_05300 [Planctomycetes bacterium RBG_16_59_8]